MRMIDSSEATAIIADYFDAICDTEYTFDEAVLLKLLNDKAVDAVPKEELLKMLDAVTDIWFWEHTGKVCNSKPLEECAGCKYEGHPFGKCLLKYLEERKKE